ncbi:aspartoacylase [Aliikangiella coralliicola]|uniref:Aspartoacylase n=1 Tax=Aliikangiella coralliicola TaxID=2592383 RepID=A0A545TW14_9GAMM|nr:aspartoacylase [Aliikangiella coralliicola]TQV81410.1 aspartoacylase [Aliikangiella coralliicola]
MSEGNMSYGKLSETKLPENKLTETKRPSAEKVGAVAVVGGTHGNELTGIFTVKHWQKNQLFLQYPEFQIEFLLANQAAIKDNKRYLEHDLNRCFKQSDLQDSDKKNREQVLAKQINQQLGPKGDSRVDFIVDLHTSTAKMQTNIVLITMDEFHLKLAAYLKSELPDVVITSETQLMDDHHFLCSIAPKGIVIEVGPTPQGSLDGIIFEKTNLALRKTLEFVNLYNQGTLPELGEELEVMSYFSKLYFPTDSAEEICATVHPELIGNDYSKISAGTPIFKDFFGEDILYEGADAHVAFVNEAAYYDQKIAMCLCNPLSYSLTTLQPLDSEKSSAKNEH